ncbi:MAG: DUF6599 family protein [Pyrinomonadaceae bacterium]
MLIQRLSKLPFILLLLSYLCVLATANTFDQSGEAAKMLPERVGEFRAQATAHSFSAQDFNAVSGASREYRSAKGERVKVTLLKTRSDSSAYALLTVPLYKTDEKEQSFNKISPLQLTKTNEAGTASIVSPGNIIFFKGANVVVVDAIAKDTNSAETALAFARPFAQTLEANENEIPVLVKHLPDWETAQAHAAYAVSLASLKNIIEGQPVLDALDFIEGTEAVVAPYDSSQLAILEYTTPQIAADNDARVKESINKLRGENQPAPSAYRRVGNYSVFVFNAPNAQTAENLINQVHYEQLVQWLGDNPRALQRAQHEYAATTAAVILSVLKASGLALILCLGVGVMFGGIVFRRRRAQQTANAAYTDAGGLMRLNLDNLSAQTDPARLLGKGEN